MIFKILNYIWKIQALILLVCSGPEELSRVAAPPMGSRNVQTFCQWARLYWSTADRWYQVLAFYSLLDLWYISLPRNNSAWNQRFFVNSRTGGWGREVVEKEVPALLLIYQIWWKSKFIRWSFLLRKFSWSNEMKVPGIICGWATVPKKCWYGCFKNTTYVKGVLDACTDSECAKEQRELVDSKCR